MCSPEERRRRIGSCSARRGTPAWRRWGQPTRKSRVNPEGVWLRIHLHTHTHTFLSIYLSIYLSIWTVESLGRDWAADDASPACRRRRRGDAPPPARAPHPVSRGTHPLVLPAASRPAPPTARSTCGTGAPPPPQPWPWLPTRRTCGRCAALRVEYVFTYFCDTATRI